MRWLPYHSSLSLPDPPFQVFLTASFQQMSSYSPAQVVSQVQSLARLGRRPPAMWLQELTGKVCDGIVSC